MEYGKGFKLTCNVLVKPLIHLFAGEFESAKWRQKLTLEAADKANECKVEKVIIETLEYFKELNPEALLCKNGKRIERPAWQIEQEKEQRLKY
jgi:hypothetical protein